MEKTIKAFTKRFEAMHKTGKTAAELIQTVGMEVLEHYKMHQDTTLINSYFKALPPGVNFKAMTMWLVAFAGVRVNTGNDADSHPFKHAKGKDVQIEAATETPWFTMAGANKPKAALIFDIKAKMVLMVKAAAKAPQLDGDFQALRKAAIAMGVPAAELPSMTDAELKASQDKAAKKAKAATADPLE